MDWLHTFPMKHLGRCKSTGTLEIGGKSVAELAKAYGTPLFVYDFDRIGQRASEISEALKSVSSGSRAYYAMKAQSNISVLRLISSKGLGMDVVSGGEIERARAAHVPGSDIVFSGVAKTEAEIRLGIQENIASFNIESPHEVKQLIKLSKDSGRKIPVALRINPDVDGKTHAKINTGLAETKFGLNLVLAKKLAQEIISSTSLKLSGISCHIGSQIFDLSTIKTAALSMNEFAKELLKIGAPLDHIDMGGGLGVAYSPSEYSAQATFKDWVDVARLSLPDNSFDLHLEPGRSIVGDAGILVTEVIDVKRGDEKNFAIVDAGMTELVRPAMYDAYHHVVPVHLNKGQAAEISYDVVGPVCETSCWLANEVRLPKIESSELLVVLMAGAYGMSMASNYNTRPRPAEVSVFGGKDKLIREREKLSSLWESELLQ